MVSSLEFQQLHYKMFSKNLINFYDCWTFYDSCGHFGISLQHYFFLHIAVIAFRSIVVSINNSIKWHTIHSKTCVYKNSTPIKTHWIKILLKINENVSFCVNKYFFIFLLRKITTTITHSFSHSFSFIEFLLKFSTHFNKK